MKESQATSGMYGRLFRPSLSSLEILVALNMLSHTVVIQSRQNANWDDVFVDENPDSAYDTFLSILTSLINKCLPLKKVKRKITDKSE